MNRTSIEWVRNPDGSQGYTWNPITGCLNHIDGLCKGGGFPCYAYKLAHGRLRQRYLANKNVAPRKLMSHDVGGQHYEWLDDTPDIDPFYPRFWDLRLVDPYAIKKPCGIFAVDMGELFGDWIPEDWQEKIFAIIKTCPQHRFYLLTKQPQNLIKWSPFPEHCYVGVTACNYDMLQQALYWLLHIKAKVKYVSIEPFLNWDMTVDATKAINLAYQIEGILDWLIIGAQTKPYKPPKIEWVEEIVRAADQAGIPVFLKNNLYKAIPFFKEPFKHEEMGKDGIKVVTLRQEMPGG